MFNWFCQGLIEEDALGFAYTLCEVVYEEKLVIMLQTPPSGLSKLQEEGTCCTKRGQSALG